MVPSPCLHPRRIYNESLGQWLSVPCGKCEACLINRGRNLTDRVNDRFLKYHFRFFGTLTYAPEFLPLAKFDADLDAYVSEKDADYHGVLYNLPVHKIKTFDKKNQEYITELVEKFGGIPVLSHRDILLFKKRLRKHIFKLLGYYEKDLYIFTVGEYGATYFRPHFHFLFGFDNPDLMGEISDIVRKSWSMFVPDSSGGCYEPFGRIDLQECTTSGSADYCAKYLACNTHLPAVYSSTVFKPFRSNCVNSCVSISERDFFDTLPVEVSRYSSKTGKFFTSPITYKDYSFVFPKYSGYMRIPVHVRKQLFEFAERYSSAKSARQAAKIFLDFYKLYTLQINYLSQLPDFLDKKFVIPDSVSILQQLYNFPFEFSEDRLTLFFRINRKIARIIKTIGCSSSYYFEVADNYFSTLKLKQLERFYKGINDLMTDPVNPMPLHGVYSLYIHTSDDLDLSVSNAYLYQFFGDLPFDSEYLSAQQANYAALCKRILRDSTKTKSRNDDFEKRGIRKKKWIPMISKRINHFLQI